ncbi:MAG: hypothetical protein HFG79_06345 [Lachnospiraceae bacterium]|jgi:hypothetical protein|nr:hypothetical protein [Lachnospiraceae bacterium]
MDLSQGNTSDSMLRQSTNFCRLSFFCSILLPYIPLPMRQPLLLFSKFIELKECMACPKQQFDFGQTKTADPADAISDILAKLSPLLSETERAQLSQMQNMMQMLKLYQTFQELAPFMNMGGDSPFPFPFFPQGSADSGQTENESSGTNTKGGGEDRNKDETDNSGPVGMLLSMLSPEQKEMFENLKTVMSEMPPE